MFINGMIRVRKSDGKWIPKHGGRLMKTDIMFSLVCIGLVWIPFIFHIYCTFILNCKLNPLILDLLRLTIQNPHLLSVSNPLKPFPFLKTNLVASISTKTSSPTADTVASSGRVGTVMPKTVRTAGI